MHDFCQETLLVKKLQDTTGSADYSVSEWTDMVRLNLCWVSPPRRTRFLLRFSSYNRQTEAILLQHYKKTDEPFFFLKKFSRATVIRICSG